MKSSRYRAFPRARLCVQDVVHFAARVPLVGGSAVLHLPEAVAARLACQPLLSWTAIFAKAVALTADKQPIFRQCYMPAPWPHIYEHPHCVANVVVERQWEGVPAVFGEFVPAPETRSLREIDALVRAAKTAPLDALGSFRRQIRMMRYPRPLRRLLWRIGLYGAGRLRARLFGTFAIDTVAARDVRVTQTYSLYASRFILTPPRPNGDITVHAFCDHRLIDGMGIVRALKDVEVTLNGDIATELRAEVHRQAGGKAHRRIHET